MPLYVPEGQVTQLMDDCPGRGLYVPGSHGWHCSRLVPFLVSRNVPAGHSTGTPPGVGHTLPTGHGVHTPATEYSPGGHSMKLGTWHPSSDVVPASLKGRLAGHGTQAAASDV